MKIFDKGELIWYIDTDNKSFCSLPADIEPKLEFTEMTPYNSFEECEEEFVLVTDQKTFRVQISEN